MVETRGVKRTYVLISESESDAEAVETSDSSDDDIDDEGDVTHDDQEGEVSSDSDKDESIRKREKNELQELTLYECKSILRKHRLRVTGTKAECVRRIREHRRIKDGNAEALYPRSSFAINCTGDVCNGDTVLFRRKVHRKSDKVTRRGSFLGTIAGRVVKESYGATKQQHTFTIEVLWSKGIKKLPPLVPILVKGRKLYRFKTFRQRWKDETKRVEVLAEKHKRGAEARLVKAVRTTKEACPNNGGVKRQEHYHHPKQSLTGKKAEPEKAKKSSNPIKSDNRCQDAPPNARTNLKKSSNPIAAQSSNKHQNLAQPNKIVDQATRTYNFPPQNVHQPRMLFTHPNTNRDQTTHMHNFPPHNVHQPQMLSTHPNTNRDHTTHMHNFPPQNFHQSLVHLHHQLSAAFPFPSPIALASSTPSAVGIPNFMPNANSSVMPILQRQVVNRGPSQPSPVFEPPRNFNPSPQPMNIYAQSNFFSLGK